MQTTEAMVFIAPRLGLGAPLKVPNILRKKWPCPLNDEIPCLSTSSRDITKCSIHSLIKNQHSQSVSKLPKFLSSLKIQHFDFKFF